MDNKPLNLRCKTKNGQHYLTGLKLSSSISQLKSSVSELTNIPKDSLKILQGYPPKVIDLSADDKLLSCLPFRSGDTLIVEEGISLQTARQNKVDNDIQSQASRAKGVLMRKVVPSDNSCLFTSIDCLMNNGKVNISSAPAMRELIAGIVLSDPVVFSDVFLGKSNEEYCNWIMNKNSWGGAIEIAILSKYYGTEINVVDTQSGRIDRFGEDQNFTKRILVIYDGVHYDPLILEPLIPGEDIQTIFPTADGSILAQAMDIASEAKLSKQYTDVSSFSLKCLICQKLLTGQAEAQQHAKDSGHINFGEVN